MTDLTRLKLAHNTFVARERCQSAPLLHGHQTAGAFDYYMGIDEARLLKDFLCT